MTDQSIWREKNGIKLRKVWSYTIIYEASSPNFKPLIVLATDDLAVIERTFWAYHKTLCNIAAGWFFLVSDIYLMKIWGFFYVVSCKLPSIYMKWNILYSYCTLGIRSLEVCLRSSNPQSNNLLFARSWFCSW